MKQALIVDPEGTVEDFARSALEQYTQTRTGSLQEAEALASSADYQLILIAKPEAICDGALWTMVERISHEAPEAAVVMVHTADADAGFHARAGSLGVTVVTAPIGVIERAIIDQVTAG